MGFFLDTKNIWMVSLLCKYRTVLGYYLKETVLKHCCRMCITELSEEFSRDYERLRF